MKKYEKYLIDAVCRKCEKSFKAYKYNVLRGWGLFCSHSCSKKGNRNRTVPKTDAEKLKISETLKRRYAAGELKSPLVLLGIIGKRGKDSPNWRGGKTLVGQMLRRSLIYKEWRMEVLKRDDFTCQICGVRGGKLHADHIKPFSQFPELRLELSNGRTLCIPCHKLTPTYGANKAGPAYIRI